jgi:hypothetical protein
MGEGSGATGVVVVLVGQQNGGDLLRREASLPQPTQQRADGEARIQQHSRRPRLRDESITAAAAAQ